ncbi:fibronectin type III domain-containing protein [Campylobacter geochelonis]|uniref:Fibronectin type III domain-containing protein n=2 Tax=Campylobacter geochelonis TaxID=1780362 RepID=A0A128EKT5_9BACT|nr:fibronectin type III domain-containing protein [Campylobacter geochelonis]CZE49195.1 fibronectin type III domain-containing protein [Campylobacter geochelonis]CZE49217.1 fibronectin type III domain-containing protein [Campylobacter geochelonis]CZE51319.1 fibronectin type III domain-containing protein [Campylobacter geochelonis]
MAGCVSTSPKPSSIIDASLPVVNSIKTISSTHSIGLEWQNPNDINVDGYYIWRSEQNQPAQVVAQIKDRFSTHYVDLKLAPQTVYRYYMQTYSKTGVSNKGITVSATTAKAIETVSFAKAIYGLPERVKLIWRPHADLRVGSYIIERKKADSSSWSQIAEVKGRLNAEYIDKGVKSGERYDYRIAVKTLDGEVSKPSMTLSAQTKELPDGTTNLKATIDQPKKIVLTWDSPANDSFDYYQIYISRSEYLPFVPLAKTQSNSYEDLINSNGAKRYYKVTFVDKDGLESRAQDVPVMGQTLQAPPAPILNEPIISNNSVVLNWSTGVQTGKYSVKRSGGGGEKTISDITQTSYVDSDVQKGMKYYYRVYSVDGYGISSSDSNEVSIVF